MPQFRKKPVVIEAVQFTEAMLLETEPVAPGLEIINKRWHPERQEIYHYGAGCKTLEGFMTATIGDWIIRGIKGEYYPCRDDIFRMTYEAVPLCDRDTDGVPS